LPKCYCSNSYFSCFSTIVLCRRDFRLLTGIPDPDTPTPQPVIWFSQKLEANVRCLQSLDPSPPPSSVSLLLAPFPFIPLPPFSLTVCFILLAAKRRVHGKDLTTRRGMESLFHSGEEAGTTEVGRERGREGGGREGGRKE